MIITSFTTGSGLVGSGLFAMRQNLYLEGTCMSTQRGVHVLDLFFLAGFFGAAGARFRWWVAYASTVVPSMSFVLPFSPAQTLSEKTANVQRGDKSFVCFCES